VLFRGLLPPELLSRLLEILLYFRCEPERVPFKEGTILCPSPTLGRLIDGDSVSRRSGGVGARVFFESDRGFLENAEKVVLLDDGVLDFCERILGHVLIESHLFVGTLHFGDQSTYLPVAFGFAALQLMRGSISGASEILL